MSSTSAIKNASIRSTVNTNAVLRMDASSKPKKGSPSGYDKTVNCQFGVGPWEKFNIEPQSDGTVAIGSVAFSGFYLRVDGTNVNCQWGVGPWEKFNIRTQDDGTKVIESNHFSGVYISMNSSSVKHFSGAGWPNTVSCSRTIGNSEKFVITGEEARNGLTISNLVLVYNTRWSTTNSKIFTSAKMNITNNTGSNFPAEGQSEWVSLDVYASSSNKVSDSMTRIGEVPANLGSLSQGGIKSFSPSDWEENNLAKMVTINPPSPPSGEYYIYIQVRNSNGTIDGSGTFSSDKYQLPPSSS